MMKVNGVCHAGDISRHEYSDEEQCIRHQNYDILLIL